MSHDGLIVSSTLVEVSTNSLSVGGKVVTLPPDLPVERLVICHREITNTCMFQIQQWEDLCNLLVKKCT